MKNYMIKRYNCSVLYTAIIFLLLISFSYLTSANGEEEVKELWCVQAEEYGSLSRAHEILLEVRDLSLARIERKGELYSVLIGFFENELSANKIIGKIKAQFPYAYKKKCINIPQLIISNGAVSSIKTIYFEELGYSNDLYLSGARPEFSLYFPKYKGLRNAELETYLRFSSVLDERSTITILVDDVPLFTKNIKQIGYEPTLSFRVKPSKLNYIKVTLRGYFFITGDICYDLPTGNLWMVIGKRSKFIIDDEYTANNNTGNYFKNYDEHYNIVFNNSEADLEVLPLVYYLNKLNDWREIKIHIDDEPFEGMKNIFIGNYSRDIEVKDENLFVSAKGVQLFKKSLTELYITYSLKNSTVNLGDDKDRAKTTLLNMGIKSLTATGIGDLSFNVPIKYSTFTGIPKNLNLRLLLNHTPIPESDRAFLKVFLNGVLIKATQLKEGGDIYPYDIKISEELLRGYNNNLNIVASYFIDRGDCKGSIPNMTFSILYLSYFYHDNVDRKKINPIMDVIGSLSGNVLIMVDNRNMLKYGVYLMDILGKFNKEISNIDIAQWKGEVSNGYDFVILLLNPQNTQIPNTPVKLNQGRFSIINPLTNTELISTEYSDSFGVLQSFDKGNSKILMLSYYKDIKALEFLKTFEGESINRLTGNVVIFNQDIASYAVGDKYIVVYKDVKSMSYYWNRFKLYIILTIFLIGITFLYYINKKLVREKVE